MDSGYKDESLFLLEVSLAVVGLHMKMVYVFWEKDNVLAFLHDSICDVSYISDFEENLQVGKQIKKFVIWDSYNCYYGSRFLFANI